MELVPIQSATYKTERMQNWVNNYIKNYKSKNKKYDIRTTKDAYGNIYVTKGKAELYPTMVCHIDTVHEINDSVTAHITDNKQFIYAIDQSNGQQYGTGGDDKVGIAITIMLFEYFENFKAVFFLDEESGCTGSSKCNASFFDDSTFVLQCDRRGNSDFVNRIGSTKLYSKKFSKLIKKQLKKYNRKECTGGITDVGEIARVNKVMCANMSCGYYHPHSNSETINIQDVVDTFNLCRDILLLTINLGRSEYNNLSDRQESYMYTGRSYGHYWHNQVRTNPYFNMTKTEEPTDDKEKPEQHYLDDEYEQCVISLEDDCPCCSAQELEYDEWTGEVWCYACGSYIDTENLNSIQYNGQNQSNKNDDRQGTIAFEC